MKSKIYSKTFKFIPINEYYVDKHFPLPSLAHISSEKSKTYKRTYTKTWMYFLNSDKSKKYCIPHAIDSPRERERKKFAQLNKFHHLGSRERNHFRIPKKNDYILCKAWEKGKRIGLSSGNMGNVWRWNFLAIKKYVWYISVSLSNKKKWFNEKLCQSVKSRIWNLWKCDRKNCCDKRKTRWMDDYLLHAAAVCMYVKIYLWVAS